MSSILDKQLVIKLNANWVAYEHLTVRDTFTFLCSEAPKRHGVPAERPGFAIDFDVEEGPDGQLSLVYANAVTLEEWMRLPVREKDLSISVGINHATGEPKRVRIPLIVICANYKDIPKKTIRWSPEAIRRRDKDTCQVSKRKLAPGEGNVGHDLAQSIHPEKRTDWSNTVWMDKRLNTLQGTRTFAEMGWKIEKPKAPVIRAKVLTADDAAHPWQLPFLI